MSLDVALAEPLGERPLVDAWTGEVVRGPGVVAPPPRIAVALPTAGLLVGSALAGSAAAGWLLSEGSAAGGRCG